MDKFPEAFERFERTVDVEDFKSYKEMSYAFGWWAGKRWVDSYAQNLALANEGIKLGFEDVTIPVKYNIRARREKWTTSYEKKAEKRRKAVVMKYKRVGKVRIKALSWYVNRGFSANKIQNRMKDRGLGIRRQTLLKIVREMKLKEKKADSKKYTPKKYRRKRR